MTVMARAGGLPRPVWLVLACLFALAAQQGMAQDARADKPANQNAAPQAAIRKGIPAGPVSAAAAKKQAVPAKATTAAPAVTARQEVAAKATKGAPAAAVTPAKPQPGVAKKTADGQKAAKPLSGKQCTGVAIIGLGALSCCVCIAFTP